MGDLVCGPLILCLLHSSAVGCMGNHQNGEKLTSVPINGIVKLSIVDLPGGVRASRAERASEAETTDADPLNLIWVMPAEEGRLAEEAGPSRWQDGSIRL
jgi:hypothetical protein